MSYLQRLAAMARNPVTSIHPVLGSVFSAPHRVDPELVVTTPAMATPTAPTPAAATPEARNRRSFEPQPPAAIAPRPAGSSFEPLIETTPPQRPKMPDAPSFELSRAVGQGSTPSMSPSESDLETMTAEFLPPEPPTIVAVQNVLKPEGRPDTAKPAGNARAAFKPLVEDSLREGTSASAKEPAKLWSAGDRPKQDRKDVSRLAAPSSREPDEIRIHIGRIEVTAAPPTPVRSDPKPLNPSLNLGDYLKRRSGRS